MTTNESVMRSAAPARYVAGAEDRGQLARARRAGAVAKGSVQVGRERGEVDSARHRKGE